MSKDNILGQCKCITKEEKNTLIIAINSAKIDAERILTESERGNAVVGKPFKEVREELNILIGNYMSLKEKVDETPIC